MARKNNVPVKVDIAEEMALLRQKCNSLALRGHYAECARLIEDNLRLMYVNERWPENFFAILRTYQRCYPALNHDESLEDRLRGLLIKNNVPFVFASFFKPGEAPVKWNAELFKERSLKARSEKDNETALANCEIAIKIDALSTNLCLLCGWIKEDMGRDAEAISMFERALELNESNIQARQAVTRLYAKTNLAKALEYINKSIEENPDEAGFYAEKAGLLLQQNKKSEAMSFYEKATDLDPYNAEYAYLKAELLMSEGNEMAAIVQYKRAAALNHRHAPSLLRLAFLHEEKQPAAALEYITGYIQTEPVNTTAMLLRASLMAKLGDLSGAIKQYGDLLNADENNIAALSGKAACHLPDNATLAVDLYEKAIALDANNPDLHMGKARAHMLQNRPDEAAGEFKTVIALNKKNDVAYGQLAAIFAEKDPPLALDYIGKAIKISPENPSYHARKADLLLSTGRKDEAAAAYNTAVKYDPGNASLHFELGVLLKSAGNRASAIKNLEEAVNIDSRMTSAYRSLAELHLYSEPDKAFYYINTAISLDIANAVLYYVKCRVCSQLEADRHARDMLLGTDNEISKRAWYDPDEMASFSRGECLRVALLYINRAIELSPNNNTYLCERAHIFYRMNQTAKALEQYRALLKSDGNNHEALFGVGIILSSKKDPKALEYLDKAIAASPATARYHAGKGDFLAADSEKSAKAIECYDQALVLDTFDFEPSLKKSNLLLESGDIFAAMDSYRRTLLINPNCFEASARMGELLAAIQPENALHYINHAIFLDCENTAVKMWRARILFETGETEAAEAQCAEAMACCGESPGGYFALAKILSGDFSPEALKYAEVALEKDNAKAEFHALCGRLFLELEDYDRAGEFFTAAIALNPKDLESRELAVEYLYKKGLPEAVEAAEALAETQNALLLKAKVFDEIADPPRTLEAIGVLTDAVKKYPGDIPLRETLVALLQKKRALLRYPIEKTRLGRLRKKLEKARKQAACADEIPFGENAEPKDAGATAPEQVNTPVSEETGGIPENEGAESF